jgi:hypothetical protein
LAQLFVSLLLLRIVESLTLINLVFTNPLRKCPHALLDLLFKKPVSASAQPWDAHYTHHLLHGKLFLFRFVLKVFARTPYTNKSVVLIVKNPWQYSARDFGLEA